MSRVWWVSGDRHTFHTYEEYLDHINRPNQTLLELIQNKIDRTDIHGYDELEMITPEDVLKFIVKHKTEILKYLEEQC